jgi:RimJ/RimL family protein N-acetyltransferase
MAVGGVMAATSVPRVMQWPTTQPVLADDTVRLRPLEVRDADAVFRACQDAAIQHFTRVPVPYLRDHAATFVGQGAAKWAAGDAAAFAVTDLDSDDLVGCCSLMEVDRDAAEAEVGYWVAPWGRSRGVAARALLLLTTWALGAGGLQRVYAEVEEANLASTKVVLAAGFRRRDGRVVEEDLKGTTRRFMIYEARREVAP